jgi:hypothetical protein
VPRLGEQRESRFLPGFPVNAFVAMLACLSKGTGCKPGSILGASGGWTGRSVLREDVTDAQRPPWEHLAGTVDAHD